MDKIIFIQKIIKFSLPKTIAKIPQKLKTCFNVNSNWRETVIDYLDDIWNQKNKVRDYSFSSKYRLFSHIPTQKNYMGKKVLHYALDLIESDKFWEIIAQESNSFFQSWDKKENDDDNIQDNTIWHYAIKKIKSENFWKIIAKKDDSFFESWNKIIGYWNNTTIWNYAINNLEFNTFWELISQKEFSVFNSWYFKFSIRGLPAFDQCLISNWHIAIKNIKSDIFWENIAKKLHLKTNLLKKNLNAVWKK
jgi:hypothetical protein